MGKKKSGGSRLKKKNLEQMVIALFEEQPNQVFELKTLYQQRLQYIHQQHLGRMGIQVQFPI